MRARNFPDEIFPLSIILYFCDHGIKSGLRPMLNCIFHTAISCWYAVSCIPKWTPYFLKNDSVTRIWFLIGLNLFRSISYSSLFNLIWLCLTPNNPIMTNLTSLYNALEIFLLNYQNFSYNRYISINRDDLIWPKMTCVARELREHDFGHYDSLHNPLAFRFYI